MDAINGHLICALTNLETAWRWTPERPSYPVHFVCEAPSPKVLLIPQIVEGATEAAAVICSVDR